MSHKASSEDVLFHTYCQEKEGHASTKDPKGVGDAGSNGK